MPEERIILGLIEEVTLISIYGKRAHLLARIDTGATSSSMDLSTAAKLDLGPITKSKVIKYPLLIGQNILKKGRFMIDPHKR